MFFGHALALAKASAQTNFLPIWQWANKLRRDILSLEQPSLEEPLPVENIMENDVEIPKILKEFYKILYTGNANEQCSTTKWHMIEGCSADAIFACSGGKRIPAKTLSLSLTVNTLTKSRD